METKLLPADNKGIALACQLLRQGQVVGIPTETVYGLAANALDPEAAHRIYAAKGRPSDNPLIVHIAEFQDLYPLVAHCPKLAEELADAFWPGPLTMIFPKSEKVPAATTGGMDTVAVRMPAHPAAREIIKECGLPTKLSQLRSKVEITPEVLRQVADTCNLIKTGPRQLSRDEIYDLLVECL